MVIERIASIQCGRYIYKTVTSSNTTNV